MYSPFYIPLRSGGIPIRNSQFIKKIPLCGGVEAGGEHYRRPKYGCKWIFWTKNTVIYQIMHDYPSKHDIINHILDGGTI